MPSRFHRRNTSAAVGWTSCCTRLPNSCETSTFALRQFFKNLNEDENEPQDCRELRRCRKEGILPLLHVPFHAPPRRPRLLTSRHIRWEQYKRECHTSSMSWRRPAGWQVFAKIPAVSNDRNIRIIKWTLKLRSMTVVYHVHEFRCQRPLRLANARSQAFAWR
jgi:hypothetical protein